MTNTAYFATNASAGIAGAEFYTLNLGTGLASSGTIIGAGIDVTDIAVRPIPEPTKKEEPASQASTAAEPAKSGSAPMP